MAHLTPAISTVSTAAILAAIAHRVGDVDDGQQLDELAELRADVTAARLVLEAALRGTVPPRVAIAAALIRLGNADVAL